MGKMARMLSIILSIVVSILLFRFTEPVILIVNVALFRNVLVVALILSNVFPSHFSMGVENFRKTNWIIRFSPIFPTTFIIIALSMLERTYALVGLVSVISGIQMGYIIYLFAIIIDNKVRNVKG